MKTRSEKHKKKAVLNKIMVVGISFLSIVSLAFIIYFVHGLFSTKELLTSKPNLTHTKQSEQREHYGNELEKESKLKEEMKKQAEKEEKEPEQIPVNDVSNQSQTSQNASNEEESYSYTYTVDYEQNNEIYATSIEQGQVYFNKSLVKDNVELSEGDTILVNFDNSDMDNVVSVELVFSVSEYTEDQEQTEAEIQNDKAFEELEKRTEELKKEVNENYEAVTGNKDTSCNVKEVTIESIEDGDEYTASNGVTFTSDQVYNGIEFNEGDNATVIYDENGNLFEVNDGILAEDGSYVSNGFFE